MLLSISIIQLASYGIGHFFHGILCMLFLFLDSLVYALVNLAYQVFLAVSQARIFNDSSFVNLATRVYIVVGVIALFLVAYALLTAIINPDNATKGDTSLGKIIPNIAMAILGIALVPTIFSYAYRVQNAILCNNVIPRLLLQNDVEDVNTENVGAEMSSLLFETFFYPIDTNSSNTNNMSNINSNMNNSDNYNDIASRIVSEDGNNLLEAYEAARGGDFFYTIFNPFILNIVVRNEIGYWPLVSTIAGGFCVYVMVSMAIDMALRAIKLAYLQLLAPLPILTIIIPGQKKVFQNWLKKTTSCFLEVFIRVFIIVFVAYLMRYLPNIFTNDSIWSTQCGSPGFMVKLFVRALLIIGICGFMKQAPKLLTDIMGIDSKGFKLGIKDKLAENGAFQAMAGLGAFGSSLANGAVGFGRGGVDLFKGAQAIRQGNKVDASEHFKNFGKRALNGVTGIPRKYTSAYHAFQNAKDAKNFTDTGKAISKGVAQGMSAPGITSTIAENAKAAARGTINTVGTDYTPYNSKAELKKAEMFEDLKKTQDALETWVDKKDDVKAVEDAYNGRIEGIQDLIKEGKPIKIGNQIYGSSHPDYMKHATEEINNLRSELKNAKTAARASVIQSKHGSEKELIGLLDTQASKLKKYRSELLEMYNDPNYRAGLSSAEISDINAKITALKDIDKTIEDIKNGSQTIYTSKIKDIFGDAGKYASYIRTQALEQESKKEGK